MGPRGIPVDASTSYTAVAHRDPPAAAFGSPFKRGEITGIRGERIQLFRPGFCVSTRPLLLIRVDARAYARIIVPTYD